MHKLVYVCVCGKRYQQEQKKEGEGVGSIQMLVARCQILNSKSQKNYLQFFEITAIQNRLKDDLNEL